jgi:hypothetical protein
MRTVSGLFDTYDQVIGAVDALSDAGVASGDITVISPKRDSSKAAEGAGIGAALGGATGLLAGLAATSLPGLGPVMGVGWLVTAAIGAAAGGIAGGIIGFLTEAGVDEHDAHVYAEGIRRGGTLVVARVDDAQAVAVRDIFAKSGSIDTASRRSEYEADGWDGFVQEDIWDEDIGSEDIETPVKKRVVARSRADTR